MDYLEFFFIFMVIFLGIVIFMELINIITNKKVIRALKQELKELSSFVEKELGFDAAEMEVA